MISERNFILRIKMNILEKKILLLKKIQLLPVTINVTFSTLKKIKITSLYIHTYICTLHNTVV